MSRYIICSKYYIDMKPLGLAQFLKPKAAGVVNDKRIIRNQKQKCPHISDQKSRLEGAVWSKKSQGTIESEKVERKDLGDIKSMSVFKNIY